MNDLYTYLRCANVVMAAWSAALYLYVDRYALREFTAGERWYEKDGTPGPLKMPKGQFISRMGRIVFLAASANSTLDALVHGKPAGLQVLGIFVGLFWVAVGCAWMTREAWLIRHPDTTVKEPK